jgi:hypothetical protein
MIVGAIGGCDLCNSSSSGMYWLDAGMIGYVKSSAGSDNIGSGWHDKSEMTVEVTSAVGMNRLSIGVQFWMVAADGLPGMRASCLWGSGNDSVDVMLDSGQGGVREALAVDNPECKGTSALSISYRVAYKMIEVYLALLRGYLVVDKGELDKL